MTILCRGDSLLGPANALGTRRVARLASQSPMVGSVDAPEPGFCPGARWGGFDSPEHGRQRTHQVFVPARAGLWHALAGSGTLGGLARAGGFWHARGPGARWWGPAHAGALAHTGGCGARWRALARGGGSGARRGVRRSLAIDAVALVLGVVLRFACCPGLPVCGVARGGERHVLLRSYVVGVHWMRAYACVALGEWRTDAASGEVYVGAGGGIASVA